jgi:hypothetical protein
MVAISHLNQKLEPSRERLSQNTLKFLVDILRETYCWGMVFRREDKLLRRPTISREILVSVPLFPQEIPHGLHPD